MDVSDKVKEAETYHSMGLLEESLTVYEQVLFAQSDLDGSTKEAIDEKITEIKSEIESFEQNEALYVSAEDIAFFKETLSITEDIPDIADSASAFMELGLFREALVEYEELLHQDYPWEDIIPDMATCLLKGYPSSEIVECADKIINKKVLEDTDQADIKFSLGLEIEKQDQKALAVRFYESALLATPKNKEIKARLETISSGLSVNSKYDYLINQNMVTVQQLRQALSLSKRMKKSVELILIEEFKITLEDLGKSLSLYFSCPFRKFDPELKSPIELIRKLKKAFLRSNLWVPLSWEKDRIEILIDDPKDLSKTDQVRTLMKTDRINFNVGVKEHIKEFINHFYNESKIAQAITDTEQNGEFNSILEIEFEGNDGEPEDEIDEESMDESSSQVVKLIDQTIIAAFRKNISDIHFEPCPESQCVDIRFRMDGICQDYFKAPLSMAKGILSRIKIMARLDIAEKRLPQDGKIKFRRKGIPAFELRVATIPTAIGYEDAVLRILNAANALDLDKIGLDEQKLGIFKTLISQPYGLVLVVGPTGSGKTTTLHSALGYINEPSIKIWTAEDPVEITQHRLRQVEVKPQIGLDFAKIMRAFLRADPDVIMIGEMRDQETASTALEASLTGHLVFSTLHTNSAAETVTRILDMGFNPIYFADALLGVLAQRLVRKLCQACRKLHHPSKQEFEEIVSEYGKSYFDAAQIDYNADLTLYTPVGCDSCSGTGYSGRVAIHELLENTAVIKNMIKKAESTGSIFKEAMGQGMTTLKQDGILKVFKGLTDLNEVRRVCIT